MLRFLIFLLALPALSLAGERTFGNGTLTEYLSIYDVDNSGGLSEEELQTLRADRENRQERLRNRWDLNQDGQISDQEREAAKETIRRQIEARRLQRFSEADLDKDNFLTPVEFNHITAVSEAEANDPGIASRLFENLDTNQDGKVSTQEFLLKLDQLTPDVVAQPGSPPHPRTSKKIVPPQ